MSIELFQQSVPSSLNFNKCGLRVLLCFVISLFLFSKIVKEGSCKFWGGPYSTRRARLITIDPLNSLILTDTDGPIPFFEFRLIHKTRQGGASFRVLNWSVFDQK